MASDYSSDDSLLHFTKYLSKNNDEGRSTTSQSEGSNKHIKIAHNCNFRNYNLSNKKKPKKKEKSKSKTKDSNSKSKDSKSKSQSKDSKAKTKETKSKSKSKDSKSKSKGKDAKPNSKGKDSKTKSKGKDSKTKSKGKDSKLKKEKSKTKKGKLNEKSDPSSSKDSSDKDEKTKKKNLLDKSSDSSVSSDVSAESLKYTHYVTQLIGKLTEYDMDILKGGNRQGDQKNSTMLLVKWTMQQKNKYMYIAKQLYQENEQLKQQLATASSGCWHCQPVMDMCDTNMQQHGSSWDGCNY